LREHRRNHVTESLSAHELRVGHELDDVREVAEWSLLYIILYISKRLDASIVRSMRDCILFVCCPFRLRRCRCASHSQRSRWTVLGGGRGDGGARID